MYDVVIVGGGLVGACCALDMAIRNPHWQILLVESKEPNLSPLASFDGRVYAISPRNYSYLHSLGVDFEQERVATIQAMHVRGNGASMIQFDYNDCRSPFLAKIIEYRNLQSALWRRLKELANVEFAYTKLTAISADAMQVTLQDEHTSYSARLLIAADGANSFVRQQFAFKVKQIPYWQAGVVANFQTRLPHNNIAHQWFFGDSILALLPLVDNHVSMVWSTNQSQHLIEMPAAQLAAKVAEASQFVVGDLSVVTQAQAFNLNLNLLEQFYQGRVILIGDAAHTIHPLAGQGVNLGFGDCRQLANSLDRVDLNKLDLATLAKYNSIRLAEVRQMQLTCHGLQRLFANRLPLIDFLRNRGLNLVNQIQPLKKLLINSAINY